MSWRYHANKPKTGRGFMRIRLMRCRAFLLISSISACLSSTSFAADLQIAPAQGAVITPSGWVVTLTGNVEYGPDFPGADTYSAFGYPSIDFRRIGAPARWTAPDDGFDFPVLDVQYFRAGPVARFVGGRYYGSDRQLVGLRKVDWTIEPGLFLEFWPADWLRARVEVRHGFHGHHGFVGDVSVDLVRSDGPYTFSIGPRLSFGDSDYADAYFSVTPLEASLNGLVTPFKASGGFTSVGALASASYKWSEQWSTTLYAGYRRLVSDAADSPITRRIGSPDQFTVGAAISYSFVFDP